MDIKVYKKYVKRIDMPSNRSMDGKIEEVTKEFVKMKCNGKEYSVYTSTRKVNDFKKAFLEYNKWCIDSYILKILTFSKHKSIIMEKLKGRWTKWQWIFIYETEMPFCPFAIDVIYLSVNLKGISVFGGALIF